MISIQDKSLDEGMVLVQQAIDKLAENPDNIFCKFLEGTLAVILETVQELRQEYKLH